MLLGPGLKKYLGKIKILKSEKWLSGHPFAPSHSFSWQFLEAFYESWLSFAKIQSSYPLSQIHASQTARESPAWLQFRVQWDVYSTDRSKWTLRASSILGTLQLLHRHLVSDLRFCFSFSLFQRSLSYFAAKIKDFLNGQSLSLSLLYVK